jgi:hypothetical protein
MESMKYIHGLKIDLDIFAVGGMDDSISGLRLEFWMTATKGLFERRITA